MVYKSVLTNTNWTKRNEMVKDKLSLIVGVCISAHTIEDSKTTYTNKGTLVMYKS